MMIEAINLSSLVIARAGSTIVEIAVLGKPMILVPWKHSAQNHQQKNAEFFLKNNSAIMITDDELTGDRITREVNDLFENKTKLTNLSNNVKNLFPTNGADLICSEIEKALEKK
jgi:UDP-N-acetylglucosamine--N-acetylmuramyl-(pentapeptide) pyrophosphoryl-undecaprenol N-acetylglucosamine transferase